MTTGRTVNIHTRVYADGYDVSGYTSQIGPLVWEYTEAEYAALTDAVKGALPNHANVSVGTLNGIFDPVTAGLHALASGAGAKRTIMIPVGIRAAPAQGDPVFNAINQQKDYIATFESAVAVTVPFDAYDVASLINYTKPWGWLLHAKGAETAVNTATGIDDNAAASSLGGYLMYQVFSGDGTATIKVQDAATNADGSFSDLSGATSGVIDCSTPSAAIVAIGISATVRRYLRWQIVLGTATTVTFALSFVRG